MSDADMDIYSPKGQLLRTATFLIDHDPKCLRVFRDETSRHIIDEAQWLHPDAITFHFDTCVEHVDLDQQTVLASLQQAQPAKLVSTLASD